MTEIEEKIQDAEIEISLAVECLEWARTKVTNPVSKHIYDHICGRILGLEQALITIKKVKAYLQEKETSKEPNDE